MTPQKPLRVKTLDYYSNRSIYGNVGERVVISLFVLHFRTGSPCFKFFTAIFKQILPFLQLRPQ